EFGMSAGIPIVSSLIEPRRGESKSWRTRNALKVFENSLQAKRVGMAYVIEVSFTAANPERAAQIANAVAETYLAQQLEAKYETTRFGRNGLAPRLTELRAQVSGAERAVIDYKIEKKLVDGGSGRLMSEEQVAERKAWLNGARARTSEARARLDRVNT